MTCSFLTHGACGPHLLFPRELIITFMFFFLLKANKNEAQEDKTKGNEYFKKSGAFELVSFERDCLVDYKLNQYYKDTKHI